MDPQAVTPTWVIPVAAVGLFVFFWFLSGLRRIRPDSVGLVERVVFGKPLAQGQLIAMKGECGYQAALLQPGLPWIPRWIMGVRRMPLVQIGPDEKGLVVAQVGLPLEQGLRTAPYKEEFGNFEDVGLFLRNGGVKGKQRIVLRPGTYKIHPVAFLVLTPHGVYGTCGPRESEEHSQQRVVGGHRTLVCHFGRGSPAIGPGGASEPSPLRLP